MVERERLFYEVYRGLFLAALDGIVDSINGRLGDPLELQNRNGI